MIYLKIQETAQAVRIPLPAPVSGKGNGTLFLKSTLRRAETSYPVSWAVVENGNYCQISVKMGKTLPVAGEYGYRLFGVSDTAVEGIAQVGDYFGTDAGYDENTVNYEQYEQ